MLASAVAALATADTFAAAHHRHGPGHHAKGDRLAQATHQKHGVASKRHAAAHERHRAARTIASRTTESRTTDRSHGIPLPPARPGAADQPAAPGMAPEYAATKQALDLARRGKTADATALAATIADPVAHTLVEWALLRSGESGAGFDRYAAFIRANPDWPSIARFHRRAEARLWQERRGAATVHGFIDGEPTTGVGRLALARALLGEGDRAGAEREARAAWRSSELSSELEAAAYDAFHDVLTHADHVARMDRRVGAKDFGAAMRAAKRLGDTEVAIVKACAAAEGGSSKGGALLDGIPAGARGDLGFALCRLHWLLRHDGFAEAVKLVLAASPDDLKFQDTDEWWREVRVLARKLLDLNDPENAYRVVRAAAAPANPYYRAEFHFMAGWIALRFLGDATSASADFARVDEGSADPIVRARAAYWRGRAAEASAQYDEMRAQYTDAARYHTAYYGQLARARLGMPEATLRNPAPVPLAGVARDLVHAADMLYAMGERELAVTFVTDLAQESRDAATLAAVGDLTARYNDAQAMLLMGKTALARGLATDLYAFPNMGVPTYNPVGPQLDRCIVYSIVRTESAFDQRDRSPAKAVGLMQVTPEAGRDTARRFGVAYSWDKLVSDPVYNTQMGAAEIAALLKEYRGSYIMTFAGYNAGRGRVQQWMAQHGDPRDPKVDAVDWVERIPFAETRNYVQRVMENLLVYRSRFGEGTATLETGLHRAATVESLAEPPAGD